MIDYLSYMREYLKIIDMAGKLVPLDANHAQRLFHRTIQRQVEAGVPIRAIVLKARREGISTYVQGRFFSEINLKDNRFATIVSADSDSTDKVFGMSKLFQEHMPADIKIPTVYSSKQMIKYAEPHRSQLLCQTAGKTVLGRGGASHYLHCSEMAFWGNAKEQFGGAVQEVPDLPDTMVVIESTANGVGGAFYDMFWDATERLKSGDPLGGFMPIFLPWFIFPDYQKKITGKFTRTHEEEEIARQYKLCDEQLNWRRWAITSRCMGDDSLFKQEFPSNAREAFQTTGRNVFPLSIVDRLELSVTEPEGLYLFDKARRDEIYPHEVLRQSDCWKIWEHPQVGHDYILGIDAMEGKLLDKDDPRSNPDFHGAVVYDRTINEMVAIYHGRCDLDEFANQCVMCATYYDAMAVPEINGPGLVVLSAFKRANYSKIYQRQSGDDQWTEVDQEFLGWRTTVLTRSLLVDDFKKVIKEDPPKIYDGELLKEMRTFVVDKNGKPIHLPGEHDDILFAAMIAIQIHLRLPELSRPASDNSFIYDRRAYNDRQMSMAGAIDAWEPGDDEDEYSWMD